MSELREIPVLIVGGGPVGLALAIDLGWRGVPCLLVEQTDGVIDQSKMGMVQTRSMELCRRWGIVDRVYDCGFPSDFPLGTMFVTSLDGYLLAHHEYPSMGEIRPPPTSPEHHQRCPQLWFDPIMARAAAEYDHVELRYGCRLESFREVDGGVIAEVLDRSSGERERIFARYLAACDGARSDVRRALGIAMHGNHMLSRSLCVYFRSAELLAEHDKGPAERYFLVGPEGTWGNVTVVDGKELWRLTVLGGAEPIDAERYDAAAALRRMMGHDFSFEIGAVLPWTRRQVVAERFSVGRVFLVGDAAHVLSPTGGFGMNTGIADAADLGWKLAAMLDGWGGTGLADSYDAERRPVAERNVGEAATNFARVLSVIRHPDIAADTLEADRLREEVRERILTGTREVWDTLGVQLGFRYHPSPLCWPDEEEPPPDDMSDYLPTSYPGARAPHAWLAPGRSTLDLFGRGFVLLRLGAGCPAAPGLVDAAGAAGVPLTVETIPDPDIAKLYARKLVLVRPDGHVGWRGDEEPADPVAVIDRLRGAGQAAPPPRGLRERRRPHRRSRAPEAATPTAARARARHRAMTSDPNSGAREVPVLIVGGGPVGLALAADLGWRGIECMLVERGDGKIFHPRANTVNSRTMEFCRRWGIADRVRNSGSPPDFPLDIVYVTSLRGFEVARIDRPTYGGAKPLPTTPERSQRCNQTFFDPIMRDLADSFPSVTLRYQTSFESFEETADGVVATVRDLAADRTETVTARYLVACCGGQSSVPRALGVQWEGTPVLSYHLNVFLRIPELWNHHDKGKAAFYFFVDPMDGNQSLIELDGNTLWRLGLDFGQDAKAAETADIEALFARWVGADVPHEVVSALPWTCRSVVADTWQRGRVFLAGDAVHQHSPSGGFGMNTGLGDAVDLGWKLAATLEGWAGPELLASYEAERRPVAERIVRQATETRSPIGEPSNLALIDSPTPEGERVRREVGAAIVRDRTQVFVSDGLVLGYSYDPSPVVVPDGTPKPELSVSEYRPTARPGSRAPHAWIADGKSTIDLFGRNFVLLAFGGAGPEGAGLAKAAADRGMPLDLVEIGDPEIARLYERKLVLVRPDGHVAWRADAAPDDPRAVIDTVRGAERPA